MKSFVGVLTVPAAISPQLRSFIGICMKIAEETANPRWLDNEARKA